MAHVSDVTLRYYYTSIPHAYWRQISEFQTTDVVITGGVKALRCVLWFSLPDLPVPILAAVARPVKVGPAKGAADPRVEAGQSLVMLLEVVAELRGGLTETLAAATLTEVVEGGREDAWCW